MLRTFRVTSFFAVLTLAALLFVVNAPAPVAAATNTWTGVYHNNTTFSGPPALVRDDADINFNWGEGSPGPNVNADNFSVRWTRYYYFNAGGQWTFTLTTDDGARLYLDGNVIIDQFYDHAPLTRAVTVNVSQGYHNLRLDYYDRTLGALAQLNITRPNAYPDWKGEYWTNPGLVGSPLVVVNDPAINFNWGTGSPQPGIPADNFSVRWTRTQNFNAGKYRFTATSDDGIRVYVDSTLLIDQFHDQPPTTYTADINLTAGSHLITVLYFERTGGALAQVSFAPAPSGPPPPPPGSWRGKYYSNPYFYGSPVLVRDDANLDLNWGPNSPGAGVPADNFSVKWDSTRNAPVSGYYTVLARADDGVRVWVDDNLIINAWFDQSATTTYQSTIYLNAGSHNVHVEYYEHTYNAEIHIQFFQGNAPPPPPPPPPPTGDVIVDNRNGGWQEGGCPSCWRYAGGINGDAQWTFNNSFTAYNYNWGRWYPSLPQARNYEVFVYIPGGVASTRNARYWIAHNGRFDLVTLPQAFFNNQWVSLGTYYFNGQGGEYVSLSDVTYECYLCTRVVWDAAKFSPR